MPRFEPFPGIRYASDKAPLQQVVSPPYDVIDTARRDALAAQHPYNAVHIDLPRGEGGRSPYEAAADLFRQWQREGVLAADGTAAFYAYRMETTDEAGRPRRTLGVIGALELSRPGEGDVLPHEHTTPKAKTDRLELLRATRANLSSIWGLSPARGLTDLLEDAAPLGTWTGSDGTVHHLGRIDDPVRVDAIRAAVASAPIVIADGHHRYETSVIYRDERRAASDSGDAGLAEMAMTFVVELVEDELTVLPIHRLLSGLPVGFDLEGALAPWFDIRDAGDVDATITDRMAHAGALCLVLPDRARLLVPRPEAMAAAQARDLDSSRLDAALAGLPEHQLWFQHGVDNIVAQVRSGEAQAGVLLRPVQVAQIAAIAEGGERMPPKSTYFHPKPSTGAVFRSVD